MTGTDGETGDGRRVVAVVEGKAGRVVVLGPTDAGQDGAVLERLRALGLTVDAPLVRAPSPPPWGGVREALEAADAVPFPGQPQNRAARRAAARKDRPR